MTKLANVILNVFVQGESLKICFEQFNGDKVFSTNNAGSTEYPSILHIPYLTLSTKISLKWLTYLYVKPKTIKLLEDTIAENLYKLN